MTDNRREYEGARDAVIFAAEQQIKAAERVIADRKALLKSFNDAYFASRRPALAPDAAKEAETFRSTR